MLLIYCYFNVRHVLNCSFNFLLSGLSLHRTRPAGQEVLHVHRHGLGEVGHAPKTATGGAVVQQPAHTGGRVPLQDVLLCSQVSLEGEGRKEEHLA